MNNDETYDENYDEIRVKTASKCLARMTGCWDPEFEPSVEKIVDYRWDMAILSVRFLWRARSWGDFPIQSTTWQVEVTSRLTGSSHAPQYSRIRSMRSLSMSPSSNYDGVFMRDSGCSLSFSLCPQWCNNEITHFVMIGNSGPRWSSFETWEFAWSIDWLIHQWIPKAPYYNSTSFLGWHNYNNIMDGIACMLTVLCAHHSRSVLCCQVRLCD